MSSLVYEQLKGSRTGQTENRDDVVNLYHVHKEIFDSDVTKVLVDVSTPLY